MVDDLWGKFENPEAFVDGDYVDAIELALKNDELTLEIIQDRLIDLKSSQDAKEFFHAKEDDPITTYCNYVLSKNDFEIDGSKKHAPQETKMLYRAFWGDMVKVDSNFACQFKDPVYGQLTGDVINSFGGLFCHVLNCCRAEPQAKSISDACNAYLKGSYSQKDFESFKEQLSILAHLTHTAGNLLPMIRESPSPNQTHSHYAGEKDGIGDRWDLFLTDISTWYERIIHGHLDVPYIGRKGRGSHGEAYMRFADPFCCGITSSFNIAFYNWLLHFESFEGFIKGNFLEDYLNKNGEVRRYSDLAIDGQDPKTIAEITEIINKRLRETNARIIARNIRMHQWAVDDSHGLFTHACNEASEEIGHGSMFDLDCEEKEQRNKNVFRYIFGW